MAIIQQLNCDSCGRVLVGNFKAQQVSRSYLEVNGFVREWLSDGPRSKWREPYFITRRPDDQLVFCVEEDDGTPRDCFHDFRTARIEQGKERKEATLRAEASAALSAR